MAKTQKTPEIRPLNQNIHRFDPEANDGELDLEMLDQVVGADCCNNRPEQCPTVLTPCTKVCTCHGGEV